MINAASCRADTGPDRYSFLCADTFSNRRAELRAKRRTHRRGDGVTQRCPHDRLMIDAILGVVWIRTRAGSHTGHGAPRSDLPQHSSPAATEHYHQQRRRGPADRCLSHRAGHPAGTYIAAGAH
jgi:hypothetical protein